MVDLVQFVNEQQSLFDKASASDLIKWEKESQFAIQAFQGNECLLKAAHKNPSSAQNAIVNVAAVGISLNPALKHAYLVPRSGMVYLDISYQGLLHIAMTSGAIEWGQAKLVYENDDYQNSGIDKPPVHKQNTFGDKGNIIGVYCTVKTSSGDYLTEEMDIASLKKVADASKASKGPWKTWAEEMMRKAVVKRASKYWPRADRIAMASDVLNEHEGLQDERIEKDVSESFDVISQDQAIALLDAAKEAGKDEQYICQKARVNSVYGLQSSRYEAAMNHIKGLGIPHESN